MYRTISPHLQSIYCGEPSCDLRCGRFHSAPKNHRNGHLHHHHHYHRNKPKLSGSLDLPTTSTEENGIPSPNRLSATASAEPTTPYSPSSTITLEDIIASARRKTSIDFRPIILPSPIFLDEVPPSEPVIIRKDSQESLHDIEDLEQEEFVQRLIDPESEDEFWTREPPSLIIDDDMADFDEIIRVTQPPADHFSNPLHRTADPLKKRRRRPDDDFDDSSSIDLSVSDIQPSHIQLIQQTYANGTSKPQYESSI